ncbi:uncharacterized protein LOC133526756 isoform X2 [Cydia pomonella]|uniref:uncharacterized protein LOC133526756 isoform X2 n=1 Tax=Cydia pomonella TaxID=82600 RepID=UPI002ADE38AD|nr:uncharacterized protein LOC133526756 isoform X2 [Cydia pomonella]
MTLEENMMNPGADEPSSGLNGRLRPRKSNIPSPQPTKLVRKSEGKTGQEKAKRTSAASKTPPNKTDDLATKSDSILLCPYCDKNFASKQTLSKHVRRMHAASSKHDSFIACLFCGQCEAEANDIIRHMAETHPQQYFACLNCHTRFSSLVELAEHKNKLCETKLSYRSRLRQKVSTGSIKEMHKDEFGNDSKVFTDGHSFNGVVISCELKPSLVGDGADIEDNITTNLILPPSKSLGSSTVIEKSAVIVLDDIQWNKRIPPNFSFHNTDADQILSRLGVVHRSPRTGESTKKDWKNLDETTQKFEKCFDTSFYSKVASNVQENLSKFLDGSFNFNPDPDSTIKTRKSKNSVVINTAEGFPILLASEQYSRNAFDRYMPRAIAPKHKWKWDNLESEKGPINPDQLKRDSHTNNCIISLVSSLDIWTQLRMRRKFEEKFGCPPLEKKTEKQTIISNELKDILESRELPTPSSQVMKMTKKAAEITGRGDFPLSLGLTPSTSTYELPPAVLSGEWVRPRCYVCCACGAQSRDSRAVSAHVATHHPNAQVQHYEIVGEQLLNADILKHLYVPPSQMCNRTRPPRGFRECTKCRKSITLDDLHQHMLDCAGDTPAVRRKCRYRPFGVRRRRPRLPDNTIRKKIRKDIRTRQNRPKTLVRPRPIRTEVGDAETIRKMIADLPAKRHRVLINPTNPSLRPRIKQRPKMLMKRRSSEERSKRIKRNKEISETRPRQGTSANDATSAKSDEDNKPLKPKMRRVTSKTPRRSEPEKRKTSVLTRAKRPNRQVKKVEKNDSIIDASNSACSSKTVMTEDILFENLPQRIDVKNDEFKTKEHAGQGQGSSNNRGGQRAGNSGQNSNSGNSCAPASNVPLKHSIARLTADSEKHDKSVQFHHLFLIQQECNNVNQHVQSGQQLLFENEAAVLTLDKPPLHYNNKGPLDALQKSKLNKPRKGLNACIAMLKNKLVEPAAESTIPAGHVSVQCGDDEPLYSKPDTPKPAIATLVSNVENVTKFETIFETSQNKSASRVLDVETIQSSKQDAKNTTLSVQSPNRDTESIDGNIEGKNQITSQNLCEVTMPEKQLDLPAKHLPSRQKSMVNEVQTIELPSHPLPITRATALKATSNKETAAPETVVSLEVVTVAARVPPQENSKRPIDKSVTNKWPNTVVNAGIDKHNTKSNDGRPTSQISEDNQVLPDLTKQSMTNHQSSINEKKLSIKEHSNVYYGNCLNLRQQTDHHSDSEYNCKVNVENFPSAEFNHAPVNNRPAHASTHIESIVSIPLDLSGKASNVNASQDLANTQNTYLQGTSYDTYETLDLSNKSQDLEYTGETISLPNDEIVDLSLKSSHLKSAEVVDILGKDGVTDLSLKSCLDVPTDLTVKKKATDNCTKPLMEISNPPASRESAPIREIRNLDKAVKPQIDNKICHLPTADLHVKDKKVSCVNLTTTKENANIIDTVPPSKSENFMSVTENSLEQVHENVPSDLTCLQRTEDILKEPCTQQQIAASFGKREDEADKNQEKYFQVHPRTCDRTFQIQKPIYDPTLKIPQYKIRVAATVDNPLNKDLPATNMTSSPSFPLVTNYSDSTQNYTQSVLTTTSEGKLSLGTQDQLTFTFGTAPLIAPSSNTANIYAITNTGITSHLNKFESTTPVYTLAKACISVTKIESTNSTTLTNTLLSIPGTTIANTTPVYTLAGTTIGIQGNYSHFVSEVPANSANQKTDEKILPSTNTQGKTYEKELEIHREKVISTNVLSNVDQDPETARKIALLPKELVDVLGNMPVDHRNKLLNILPQYVSTSTGSDSGLKSEHSNQSESTSKLTTPEPNEVCGSSVQKNKQESESKMTSPLLSSNSGKPLNIENTASRPPIAHPTTLSLNHSINSDEDVVADESFAIQARTISKDEPQTDAVVTKSDALVENSLTASTAKRLSLSHSVSVDKIIDLTEDEAVTRTEIHNEPIVEAPPQMSLLVHPKRNKSNNDQTASLRAVRIKAPSARQRSIDSQLAKYTSMAPVLKMNNNEHDNEVEKSLHVNVSLNTDISLAIQQAEVSSTQHSNKNVAAECKFPSVTSPNVQESNLDETNSCTRRLSTASKDENIKIDDIHNIKSVVKTTLVTSSVVNSEINKDPPQVITKEYISLKSNLDTKYIHSMKLDISSDDSDSTKNNSAAITKSSLDISESYDLPVNCSTPKTGKETDVLITSPERRLSVASEVQEDSDDDLSLAVICKQKQQNLLKIDPVKDSSNSEKDDIATKKKGKKSEKNILVAHDSSLGNNNTVLTVSLDKEKPVSFMESDKYSTKAPVEESLKQKNRKLRRKNIAKNTQFETTDTAQKSVMNSVAVDNKSDEVHIGGSVIDKNTNHKNDIKLSIGTSRKRSKVNEEIIINETINVPRGQENNYEPETKASPVRKKNKKKKKTPTSQPNGVTSENQDEKNNEITEATSNNKNATDQSGSSNTKERGSKVCSVTIINETSNMDNISLPAIVAPVTSCSSLDEASNMITPLRRSRRVRSRNNSVPGEELHVDTLQENRTPLTKKQLIFSKLLLDEENNVKTSDSENVDGDKGCAGENVDNLRKITTLEVVTNNVMEDNVPVDSNIKEKNKSIKRKKSANLKRKFKKKKPINTQFSCGEDGVEEGIDITLQDQNKDGVTISHEEQRPSETPPRSFDDSDICATSTSDTALLTAPTVEPIEIGLAVSIEKRKSGDLPHIEPLQSSQPKKIKLNASEVTLDVQCIVNKDQSKFEEEPLITSHSIHSTNDTSDNTISNTTNVIEGPDSPDTTPKICLDEEKHIAPKSNENYSRVKTCYNTPAAGRRTRSKSAVIKSVVYDPYDIDMDDMIEHAEPLRQRKTSTEYRSPPNAKQSTCSKENVKICEEDSKKLQSCSKHDGNDSDDSSKSDVPLKQYVEEKEKKICGVDKSILNHKNDVENELNSDLRKSKKSSIIDKKNRRTLGVCNTDEGRAQDETDEQLRSEQFMESFGFFSERKPRKSNLLATKKISETFHIIANEAEDMVYQERNSRKDRNMQNENRKSVDRDSNSKVSRQRSPLSKKTVKRGRKKKNSTTVTTPSYCNICKKEFRRSDNFLRHQITLLHVSKMSEVEMKIKTVPIQEEPNYLIAYKEHLDRLKIITDKMLKRKKNSKSAPKVTPLSLEEILADVNKIVREQQLSHRGLSCDEELFLDCCELLKESHKKQEPAPDIPSIIKDTDDVLCPSQAANVGLDLLGKTDIDVKSDNNKNDGDVDSITAKTILESEEVRNLENDLISGLKEAANKQASTLNKSAIVFQQTGNDVDQDILQDFSDHLSSPAATEAQYEQLNNYEERVELNAIKDKKYPEYKEKMYPDVEEFDMFEDKFDKIKRKCRSQAAAAKQPQLVVEPSISRKGRKKIDKKKGKKNSKKNHPNTVLTKGALKGFDGIKVSIPTSDINISAIVSPLDGSHKKKKKSTLKKKRENKNSESSSKYDSDHPLNDSSASLKNVDVYEFMDNEDVELFEFRPSTLMERFKSITNKDTPSTSKVNPVVEEADHSSASGSDGDDFVYMSDDYVCSDDETENSLMSCDVSNTKISADTKKLSSQMKKRDAVEKNAVMGKIFKNNAVRSEKKTTKSKELAKPKANLDQLFDSLLEDEPSSSMLNDESLPLNDEAPYASKYENIIASPSQSDELLPKYEQYHTKKKYNLSTDKENYSSKYKNHSSDNDDDDEPSPFVDYGPSTSKLCLKSFISDHKSTKPGLRPSLSPPELKPVSPKKCDNTSLKKHERMSMQDDYLEDTGATRKGNDGMKKSNSKSKDDRSPVRKIGDSFGISSDYNEIGLEDFTSDETGVARQRARRKCTVGKQNILAETWSSESEPDGGPPRPNSAGSIASGTTRKKKGKKKDWQHTAGRRTNNRHISFKKQEIVSRVSSSIRNTSMHTSGTSSSEVVDNISSGSTLVPLGSSERSEPSTSAASASGGGCMSVEEPPAIPSTSSGASISSPSAGPSTSTEEPLEPTFLVPAEPGTSGGVRTRMYYWSSDGSDNEQVREALAREELARAEREHARVEDAQQQQQQQQHGWIVGDSHKKLVTMLAHAKGRKRNNNNDDKRHKTE